MIKGIRRLVAIAILGFGVGLGVAPGHAAPSMAVAPGLPMVQPVQYYDHGGPFYGYRRPYYARPYDRPYPRYDARRFDHGRPHYDGRFYDHHRFDRRFYDRPRFYR